MKPTPPQVANLKLIVRRAVWLALAPAAACGEGTTPGGAFATQDGGPSHAHAVDAGPVDAGPNLDPCQPKLADASIEGTIFGGGCTPYWIVGDGIRGGVVAWPCGAADLSNDARDAFSACADRCLGSTAFNSCEHEACGTGVDLNDPHPTTVTCRIDGSGRRPAGLCDHGDRVRASVGDVLARAAFLEAASVEAFEQLAVELSVHRAPAELLARLREAALDEVRHARDVAKIAARFGGRVSSVTVERPASRELFAIALDNAREGCVRETYGVAVAFAQAARASDPELRTLMDTIGQEELRHAQLSWDLAAWLDAQLTDEQRAQVAREREAAIEQLAADVEQPLPSALREVIGLPTAEQARAMVAALRRDLWAQT